MTLPLISVIIPVFNGERFLAEALASIQNQNYTPLEIIVVDDGSTDNTAKIAQSTPGVCYFHQDNQGPGIAKNTGLLHAQGEYIKFLDCDDLQPPHTLLFLAKLLGENNDFDIVNGLLQDYCYDQDTQQFIPWQKPYWNSSFGACLCRKKAFDQVGLFNSQYYAEDTDWFFRALELGIIKKYIPVMTLWRRLHDQNLTNNRLKTVKGLLIAAYLHEKRIKNNPNLSKNFTNVFEYCGCLPYDLPVIELPPPEDKSANSDESSD